VIGEAAARQLNHLSIHGACGDQADCSIEVWYPPHAISVEISGPDGPAEFVQYESCYELAGGSIPRDVMAYRCSSDRIHEVPGSSGSSGDRQFVYGKSGDVVYRFDWPDDRKSVRPAVEGCAIAADRVLHESTIVRTEVQQMVRGVWTPLTRFRFGGGTGFWLAPEDTIQLQARFAAFGAKYFSDRVVIGDRETSVATGLGFAVSRPQDGYWPYAPVQDFFREFRNCIVAAGDEMRWSYPTRGEPIVQTYTLDLSVVRDGTLDPLRWVLSFHGPNMAQPSDPNEMSDWPLVLSELRGGGRADDLGYPGGALVPRWAVDKLLDLGPGHLGCNAENLSAYGELLQVPPKRIGPEARSSSRPPRR
jgi:hypothetical protein